MAGCFHTVHHHISYSHLAHIGFPARFTLNQRGKKLHILGGNSGLGYHCLLGRLYSGCLGFFRRLPGGLFRGSLGFFCRFLRRFFRRFPGLCRRFLRRFFRSFLGLCRRFLRRFFRSFLGFRRCFLRGCGGLSSRFLCGFLFLSRLSQGIFLCLFCVFCRL